MATYTIKLINKIESFNNKDPTIAYSNGFIFKYDRNFYIISIHHFLPILQTLLESTSENIELKSNKNIYWNELIVFDSPNKKFLLNTIPIKNYRTRINKKMTIKFYNLNKIEKYEYYDIHNFCANPLSKIRSIYIRFLIKECKKDEYINIAKGYNGLSGIPIFDNDDNLIGIFCKIGIENNDNGTFNIFGYILPVIYLLRSLKKTDNESMYHINLSSYNDFKMGKYDVQNTKNELFIHYLPTNCKIPLDIYFALEGDNNKEILCKNSKTSETINLKFIKNDNFDLDLNLKLNQNNEYKLNTGFMSLLLKRGHKMFMVSIINKYFKETQLNNIWIKFSE